MTASSDALPPVFSLRRSATLPTKLSPRKQRFSDSAFSPEDHFFYHPSAKIVHFAPRALAPIPSSSGPSDFDYPVDTIETLPWRSPTERTVAFAPLRLEKVQGLTVFLKCGSVVHAILKNSQCWCVDGESTFVLRIRPLTYYRIELPNETEGDKTKVGELKTALSGVLRYEVTPCPFKRGFTVEIPEEAKAPRRKRAWRPKGRRESAPAVSSFAGQSLQEEEDPAECGKDTSDTPSTGEDTDGSTTDDNCVTSKNGGNSVLETIPDETEPVVIKHSEPIEIPAPEPRPSFDTLLARFNTDPEPEVDPDISFSSSVDSFHSVQVSSHLPEAPSDLILDSSESDSVAYVEEDSTEISQPWTAVPKRDSIDSGPAPKSFLAVPGGYESSESAIMPTGVSSPTNMHRNSALSHELRRRVKASRNRDVSPLPPSSTLYHPGSDSSKQITASFIRKSCTLVLIPPIQLFIVLIHIAARIVLGPALNPTLADLHPRLEQQSVSNRRENEDDFGLPLPSDISSPSGETQSSADLD
ncbi:hypothetical protein ASPZODRAFT_61589 [Penicilliopsis zonata CBS 506.65]|uniref:Inheritance of peroxisomes protein 1 n=1 Tax=Penicilliopsis zonata CBS 506.65 TaxID=1073090 RepID=A0A1L9SN63_9EURO|nr:hypothetical protein ASPZODRAFT_61589 [Penicilliopsis zonata CBS 506.65]OJJ48702.1 hypothetical protein ASPZODRAFT_61589 [Penicilliopsis zonata CBS 506.65]